MNVAHWPSKTSCRCHRFFARIPISVVSRMDLPPCFLVTNSTADKAKVLKNRDIWVFGSCCKLGCPLLVSAYRLFYHETLCGTDASIAWCETKLKAFKQPDTVYALCILFPLASLSLRHVCRHTILLHLYGILILKDFLQCFRNPIWDILLWILVHKVILVVITGNLQV